MTQANREIPERTPLFHALQSGRYDRRSDIQDIERITGRKLLVYFAKPHAGIDHQDVAAFGDLLHGVNKQPIDLLLQSPGGDIDIAEKLVNLIVSRSSEFRVIVAESAKSAATLMALASDEIVMGDTSELGPIDPQVTVTTAQGEMIARPASSFLDGLELIKRQVDKSGELSPVYFPLLATLDPALLDYCEKAIERSQRFAEKWLLRSQCKLEDKAREISKKLADTKEYLSHGAMIDHKAAKELGLKVKFYPHEDELSQRIWRLYCKYEIASTTSGVGKMFESAIVSLSI